ncbi:MAG: tetratricopeptide repeat protein [Polyangiaceae bacterium]
MSVTPALLAAPKDDAAKKLDSQAMDDDFLNSRWADAEKKLRKAVDECGESGCSKELKAKVLADLGIIQVNAGKQADAVESFVKALKADPNVKTNPDYTSPDVTKAFEEAKKKAGSGGSSTPAPTSTGGGTDTPPDKGPAPASDLNHEAVKESVQNTPIPIYASGDGVASMKLFYKTQGESEFKQLKMTKMGKGYGVEIPCGEVKSLGKVTYYITAFDSDNSPAGAAGSKKAPYTIQVKAKIEGEGPAFPGKDPPAQCKSSTECMSGVGEDGCGGTKEFGESCSGPKECKSGLSCQKGTCQPGDGGEEESDGDAHKKNWVSLGFDLDIAMLSGSDLCSQQNQKDGIYTCFKSNDQQYVGKPRSGNGGTLSGIAALGTMRVLVGYDRFFTNNIAGGVKVGYGFRGSPEDRSGNGFFPFHAEARGTYWVGKNVLTKPGLFPFIYVAGGLAQVDAEIPNVRVPNDKCGSSVECTGSRIDVSAWKRLGRGFVGAGGGAAYAISKSTAMTLDVKFAAYLGTSGFAISPTIGVMQGF